MQVRRTLLAATSLAAACTGFQAPFLGRPQQRYSVGVPWRATASHVLQPQDWEAFQRSWPKQTTAPKLVYVDDATVPSAGKAQQQAPVPQRSSSASPVAATTATTTSSSTTRQRSTTAARPDVRFSYYGTLHDAIKQGNMRGFKFLVGSGVSLEDKDERGRTPLHVAAEWGTEEMVRLLLSRGASPKSRSYDGRNAMHAAAAAGRAELLCKLAEAGVGVREKTRWSQTPLHSAAGASVGAAECVRALVDLGADVEAQDHTGATPLLVACTWGRDNAISALIGCGANLNAQDRSGRTAIHHAASLPSRLGADRSLRVLMKHGADVMAAGPGGLTALDMAVDHGDRAVIRAILEAGVTNGAPQPGTDGPLHRAASGKRNKALEELLSSGGTQRVNEEGAEGLTPLMLAVRAKNVEGAKTLLAYGADHTARSRTSGETATHMACFKAGEKLLRVLVDLGRADVHARDANGGTPVHTAAQWGNRDALKLLVEAGASVNARDIAGETPLHIACASSNLAMVRALVSYGADIHAQDHRGFRPRDLASAEVLVALGMDGETGASEGVSGGDGERSLSVGGGNREGVEAAKPTRFNEIQQKGKVMA